MADQKPLNRRSFLASVAGVAGGGLALSVASGRGVQAKTSCDLRTGLSDNDDSTFGDERGCGRHTGVNDRDATDTAGRGRGVNDTDQTDGAYRGRGGNGTTDRDSTDQVGRGRGVRGSGVSDSDAVDRGGFGRHTEAPRQTGSGQRVYTGRNDSDSGNRADEAGYGR